MALHIQLSLLEGESGDVRLSAYQSAAAATDESKDKGMGGLSFLLLGLFGEIGSLLSELKKKRRDEATYLAYEQSVIEELGDALWYFAAICSRANMSLDDLGGKVSRELVHWHADSPGDTTFSQLQGRESFAGPRSTAEFESGLIGLAGKVGLLLDDFSVNKIDENKDRLAAHMVDILRALVLAANDADVSLGVAAIQNIEKTRSRWPEERNFGSLYDKSFDVDEQLPRLIFMEIIEKEEDDRSYVIQKCNGIIIGDRLTDNRTVNDDYRFHDVFHLAFAAILGWSPVTRALFKVKRKSNPAIDENQDGARAILIEEGISTWVFNHAMQLEYFDGMKKLDFALLKTVKEFVRGYEVENRPYWQWEYAILEGYRVFRELRTHRQGRIVADMNDHSIKFEKIEV